eukprot:TRINITY_DN56768_c0_g1_i1.p1 TRINITY_DN56768_c0_g1~~TRINITY_DN56768_c0_g1_i1.p1  ORF type:complete len:840 (+),score=194.27 TRINITY_DN56768_c0_g1_i1:52-2571(+)
MALASPGAARPSRPTPAPAPLPLPGAGTWDGTTFRLREFAAAPGGGSIRNVEYVQTMSRVVLRYKLRNPLAGVLSGAEDLDVRLSRWELRVGIAPRLLQTSSAGAEQLSAVSGSLAAEVRPELSWWTLQREGESGSCLLTVELAKANFEAWRGVWQAAPDPRRSQRFPWKRDSGMDAAAPASQAAGVRSSEASTGSVDSLRRLRYGPPSDAERDRFVIARESLCVGLEDAQDAATAILRISLDAGAIRKVTETVCLGDLFGVDVRDRFMRIFIRGDETSPICMGELGGRCIPEKTTWELSCPRKDVPHYLLTVQLAKARNAREPWPKLLRENPLALQRGAAPASLDEFVRRISSGRCQSPDRSDWSPEALAGESKAKGDDAFNRNEYRDAIVHYTRAIAHAPEDERLFSNRSACYAKRRRFAEALADAERSATLKPTWAKAYFRKGVALRGLQRWDDAKAAFTEGRFRDPANPDWAREIEKTEQERAKLDEVACRERELRRDADRTTELNEATTTAERDAIALVASEAAKRGRGLSRETGELAMQAADAARQRVHEQAKVNGRTGGSAASASAGALAASAGGSGAQRAAAASGGLLGDSDDEGGEAPYRIVNEDGSVHEKGFAHTEKGMYFMGMTRMNYKAEPSAQPWVEIRHPRKLRWSQGCALLRLRVPLPSSVAGAGDVEVKVTASHLRIGTRGDADPVVEGDLERRVDPEGESFCWYLEPDASPPLLELVLDKDTADAWQTTSYGELLWPRLFRDDAELGRGLFEADLTDLPPHLLAQYRREQDRAAERSRSDRERRERLTEEEINEETARNWNNEFARHGIPNRMETREDELLR